MSAIFCAVMGPSAVHLTVSLFLCSSAQGKSRASEVCCVVSSKSPSRVREGDELLGGNKEKSASPKRGAWRANQTTKRKKKKVS